MVDDEASAEKSWDPGDRAELVNARKLLDLPVERENRPARVESDVKESEEEAEGLTEVSS
ncbi:TPA: hypothetical protein ACH3X3_007484 [Trebouxia sp. C0006]